MLKVSTRNVLLGNLPVLLIRHILNEPHCLFLIKIKSVNGDAGTLRCKLSEKINTFSIITCINMDMHQ